MIKIGFELEVDEGTFSPSTQEVTQAIREALPKEMWADHREETWGIATIFPLDADGLPLLVGGTRERPTRELLQAQLNEQKTLVATLDRNLIDDEKQIKELQAKYDQSLADWSALKDDRDARRKANTELLEMNAAQSKCILGVQKAMEGLGFKFDGWGDDDQLIDLEDKATRAYDLVGGVIDQLDEIRTQR